MVLLCVYKDTHEDMRRTVLWGTDARGVPAWWGRSHSPQQGGGSGTRELREHTVWRGLHKQAARAGCGTCSEGSGAHERIQEGPNLSRRVTSQHFQVCSQM